MAGGESISPVPVVASRGCPYGCEFCSVVAMFGRQVRSAEPVEVVRALKRAEPKRIFFCDDNFFISKRRGRQLLLEMIRQQLDIPFFAQIRADSVCKDGRVGKELLRLMWDAGWSTAYLGLESDNPATLESYHKETSVDDMVGGMEALAETGIKTHGMFIFGADSDTPESLSRTVDFALEHGLSSAQFVTLLPLPGTPLTAQLEAEGRIFTRNWTLYDGFHVVFWSKQMTPYELQEATMEANKRFYTAGRVSAIRATTPVCRKHRLQGYLISRAWEHMRENGEFLWELNDLSESSAPQVAVIRSAPEGCTPIPDCRHQRYDVDATLVRNPREGPVMSRAAGNVRLGRSSMGLGLAGLLVGLLLAAGVCGCQETITSSSTTLADETTTTVAIAQFTDVPSDHVYYVQITDLAARDVVSGFTDGSFQPDTWVSRQQFAKMIVLTAGYPVSEDDVCTFDDVQKSGGGSLYPDNFVAVCAARGITQGRTPTQFAPEDNVTRAQLITMVARAADLPDPPPGYALPFSDFSAAHYPWARKAYYSGLLDGLQEFKQDHKGAYDFWANATRAEACVLLYGLLYRDPAGSN